MPMFDGGSAVGGASSPSATFGAAQSPPRRLQAHSSRERSPVPRSLAVGEASRPEVAAGGNPRLFADNQTVLIHGLSSRLELNGQRATIVSFDAVTGRYAVSLATTSEKMKIREANIKVSIFG